MELFNNYNISTENRYSQLKTFFLMLLLSIVFFILPVFVAGYVITNVLIVGVLMSLAVIFIWNMPDLAILVIIAAAPVIRSFKSELVPPEMISMGKAVFVYLTGIVWYIKQSKSLGKVRLPSWAAVFLAVWFCLTLVSFIYSMNYAESLQYLFSCFAGYILFFICFSLDKSKQKRILDLILFMALLVSVYAIIQFFCGTFGILQPLWRFLLPPREHMYMQMAPDMDRVTFLYRAAGTFSHPNYLGNYLALIAPFACVMINEKEITILYRIFAGILLLLICAALFATNSRAGISACICGLFYVALHKKYRWLIIVFALISFGVFIYYSQNKELFVKHLEKVTRTERGLSGRNQIWKNGLEIIKESPWLGVGPGNLPKEYVSRFGYFVYNNTSEEYMQMYFIHYTGEDMIYTFHMHNVFLQLMAEAGIFAPILFLCGVTAFVLYMRKRSLILIFNSMDRGIAIATGASAISFVIYGCFDSQIAFPRLSMNLIAAPLIAIGMRV